MDREEKLVKEFKECWFKDHVAELKDFGDIKVLDWRKPGTINFYVRYVFDGNRMYVSGDLGSAVFVLTWKADVHSFNDVNIEYFESKMEVGEKKEWSSYAAKDKLNEWKEEIIENYEFKTDEEKEEFEDLAKNLIDAALECSSVEQWVWECVDGEYNDEISNFDVDYWEWMYEIGDVISRRAYAFLTGLKMASEQLKNRGDSI